MDELDLTFDLSEIDLVEKLKGFSKFSFPVVYFGPHNIYFNTFSKPYLPHDAIKWYTTTEYVIGLPAVNIDKQSWKLKPCVGGVQASFPHALKKEKKLKPGYYKLYKYKDGIAFKRYEPIDT